MATLEEIFRFNLRRLLKDQKQLAVSEKSKTQGRGVSQQYIEMLVNGKRVNPTLSTIEAIAIGLGVPAAELLDPYAYETSLKKARLKSS